MKYEHAVGWELCEDDSGVYLHDVEIGWFKLRCTFRRAMQSLDLLGWWALDGLCEVYGDPIPDALAPEVPEVPEVPEDDEYPVAP